MIVWGTPITTIVALQDLVLQCRLKQEEGWGRSSAFASMAPNLQPPGLKKWQELKNIAHTSLLSFEFRSVTLSLLCVRRTGVYLTPCVWQKKCHFNEILIFYLTGVTMAKCSIDQQMFTIGTSSYGGLSQFLQQTHFAPIPVHLCLFFGIMSYLVFLMSGFYTKIIIC